MTIKPQVVIGLLRSLQERIDQLQQLQAFSLKELTEDFMKWNALLHLLQVSVEIVTDVCAHLLTGLGGDVPDSHRLIIRKMSEPNLNILPADFANQISAMVGFRNIVVHNYLTVDPEKVANFLYNHLDDLRAFRAYIYEYLQRAGNIA
jgi:uncharacterized protein YutE (UPF0331/DUF86 family)